MKNAIPSLSKFYSSDNSDLPRGEHGLLVQFLFRGILDLVNAEFWHQGNALLWLADETPHSDRYFPFRWTCQILGVDPRAVRSAIADSAEFPRIIAAVANDGRVEPRYCQCHHLLSLLPHVTPQNYHQLRDQTKLWLRQREREQRRRIAWTRHCNSSGQALADSPFERTDSNKP